MKITDRRIRKLEDRFGTGSRKPRLVYILCRAGGRLALDTDTCIQILDECGFLPTDPIGLGKSRRHPRWPERAADREASTGERTKNAVVIRSVVTPGRDSKMTNKTLSRRLERLEARLLPATEERVLVLDFISADGEVVGTKEFRRSEDRRPIKKNRRRWR